MSSAPITDFRGPPGSRAILSPPDFRRRALPTPLTPFVGRQDEVSTALALLHRDDVRLITMTGPGGVGKTRLAFEVASRSTESFPDGVVLVELASIHDPDLLIPTIARTFDVPVVSGQPPQHGLARLLRIKRSLLVLDNFERLVSAAPSISELLAECPLLKILVASRTVLNVQGEHEFHVPPLSMPEQGPGHTWKHLELDELARYDAITLFIQRARSVLPSFMPTADNSLAIISICRRLDGLPLAIELAAARLKVLTPEALLARLASSLDMLVGGARDQPARLQAMRATIAWSYELLDPVEQALFQQLAVFVGGFTLDAAETVCGAGESAAPDVLAGIAAIVDSSLITPIKLPSSDLRFEMLETIREFGLEQLAAGGREQEARKRHFDWCVGMALEGKSQDFGANETALLDRLELEHDNIRGALAWSIEHGQIEAGMQLACWVWPLWFFRSYFADGRTWMERLVQRAETSPSPNFALTLGLLGMLCGSLGLFQTALGHLERATALARELGDRRCLAICTLGLADVFEALEDFERAESLSQEAAALLRETSDDGWLVGTLSNLAMLAHRRGDGESAGQFASEALAISRRIGFPWGVANTLSRQARFAADAGDYRLATGLFQESLVLWDTIGDRWRVTRALADLADIAAMTRQPERAARLLGAADALNEPMSVAIEFAERSGWRRAQSEATAQLDPAVFQQAWNSGRQLAWDEAIAEALESPSIELADPDEASPRDPSPSSLLSRRESEVLQLLVAGQTDREIAAALFISPRTAQGHVASIFNKLGVNSRTAAVAFAIQNNLIPLDGGAR
jgi:non-specific serine/threonine protein kinase